jgi:peptidylprolyl isomerase
MDNVDSARRLLVPVLALAFASCTPADEGPDTASPATPTESAATAPARSAAEVMESIRDDEWRTLDPESTVYLELPGGQVVLELAPRFAPRHVENIRALVRGGYFDEGAVGRSQDNYVAQWGPRPLMEGEEFAPEIATALPAEFEVAMNGGFTPVPDGDVYAPEAGFVDGFPVGRDPSAGVMWMAHCYGVVGVARGNDPGSGNGGGLYAVTGHSPRHLDRNLSMVGRVVSGMEHLSSLPRGTGPLGTYETPGERVPIASARMGSDVPVAERAQIELLRTDSDSFRYLIMAVRSRTEDFFVHPTDRIGLCNVRMPTRPMGGGAN